MIHKLKMQFSLGLDTVDSLSVNLRSYILTYGHEGWVMTVRTRVQAAKMGFLRRVAGVSLSDR